MGHYKMKNSPKSKSVLFGALNSKAAEFLTRKDLKEVVRNRKMGTYEEKYMSFSSFVARKFAVIYLFEKYFKRRNQIAWDNSILEVFGWKEGENKHPYQMILYRQIRDLRRDFNIEVDAIRDEKDSSGRRYYEVSDYGVFNPEVLSGILDSNAELFEKILNLN